MRQGIVMILGAVLYGIAFIIVNITTPDTLGPFGILGLFMALYGGTVSLFYVIITSLSMLLKKILHSKQWQRTSSLKLYYYASILALAPIILLGMQSIGGVRPLDAILLFLFEVLACFYIHRRF